MGHFEQFYVFPDDVTRDELVLRTSEFNHAVRVLRKKAGDQIMAVDGCGHRFTGIISNIDQQMLQVRIEQIEVGCSEPRLNLLLAQGVPKGGPFDWVVEKGTEIGISAFQPMQTARSVAIPQGRQQRWQEKARAAMKQSGRCCCPIVHPLAPFSSVLTSVKKRTLFIAHDTNGAERHLLADLLPADGEVCVLIGPEGGFTEQEVAEAVASGAHILGLGTRRLRSETAALVAAVRILGAAGELG